MKKPKITCKTDWIQIEVQEAKLGALDATSIKSGRQDAVVIGIGPDVKDKTIKVGDRIFIAAWAVEVSLLDGVVYNFIKEDRQGIPAGIL